MERQFENGNELARPDRVTINTISAAYAKTKDASAIEKALELRSNLEKKYDVKPDSISHNIIVDSWCKSGRKDSPEQVMEILNAMESDFKNGVISHKPDGYTYSSVIGCFVKFGRSNAARKAEELLSRMKKLYHEHGGEPVSVSVYNAVLNAWASMGSPNSSKRVRELLQEMEDNCETDPAIPAPNLITYNTVIKAMRDGTESDAVFSEQMLWQLESKGRNDDSLLPDSYSYTSVISAYGRSNVDNKADKALEIIERMLSATERGNIAAKPTVHSFNAALNACAFAGGDFRAKEVAFDTAVRIYKLLESHDEADHTTYGTMLRSCSSLLIVNTDRREAMVEGFFEQACKRGYVGRLVLKQMQFAASPDQYKRLLGRTKKEDIQIEDIPQSWKRHVREKNQPRSAA